MNTVETFSIKIGQTQSDLIENLEILIDMSVANLAMLMATGQEKQFLVDEVTIINSVWSVQMLLEQSKMLLSEIQLN